MKHHFECDNCGVAITTYCFDSSGAAVFIYEPPIEGLDKPTHNAEEVGKILMAMATQGATILCRNCVDEKEKIKSNTPKGYFLDEV